jgi:hypothetical protein
MDSNLEPVYVAGWSGPESTPPLNCDDSATTPGVRQVLMDKNLSNACRGNALAREFVGVEMSRH